MAHPDQPLGHPARLAEARAQAGAHGLRLHVDAAVLEAGEGAVGEGGQLRHIHARVALDVDEVVGEVVRVGRGAQDRAVLPGLEHVADGRQRVVLPGPRPCGSFS